LIGVGFGLVKPNQVELDLVRHGQNCRGWDKVRDKVWRRATRRNQPGTGRPCLRGSDVIGR